MPIYRVIRKSDQVEVYRYSADSPIEWAQPPMPFADYDHIEVPPDPEDDPGPAPYQGPWHITKRAFRARFTPAEKVAIEIASLDDPTASMQVRGLAATLRAQQREISDSPYVDLQFAPTRDGTQALETYGLLAAGRAAAILDTPPTDEELYRG